MSPKKIKDTVVAVTNIFFVVWATRSFGDGNWLSFTASMVAMVVITYLAMYIMMNYEDNKHGKD